MYEGNENFIKVFKDESEMATFLTIKDGGAKWHTIDLTGASLLELDEGPMTSSDTVKKLNLKVSEDAIASVGLSDQKDASHTVLRDSYGGKTYLMSNSGRRDFLERAGAACPLINKVPTGTAFDFVNKGLPFLKGKKVLLKEEDEKLWCCHGANYSILPIGELFEAMTNASLGFNNPRFIHGTYTHEFVSARWECQDDKVSEAYKEYAFEATGNIYDHFFPVIYFSTSDVGDSCATAHAELSDGKRFIQIGSPIRLKHNAGATIDKFEQLLDGLFAAYKKGMNELQELYNLKIEYPLNCAMNIAHAMNVSIPCMKAAVDMFGDMFTSGQPTTASEVFFLLQEGLYLMERGNKGTLKENKSMALQVREGLTRVLAKSFKWEEYDSPTIFNSKSKK